MEPLDLIPIPPVNGMRGYTLSPYRTLPGPQGVRREGRVRGEQTAQHPAGDIAGRLSADDVLLGAELYGAHNGLEFDPTDVHRGCKDMIARLAAELDMAQSQLAAARRMAAEADPDLSLSFGASTPGGPVQPNLSMSAASPAVVSLRGSILRLFDGHAVVVGPALLERLLILVHEHFGIPFSTSASVDPSFMSGGSPEQASHDGASALVC